MAQFGLIGYPLTHSFSPDYFREKFRKEGIKDTKYDAFPLEKISQLKELIYQKPEIKGLNVTIPYKESVLDYLDAIDPLALEVGAVNTILIKNGKLKGYNTDISGFTASFHSAFNQKFSGAIILGTGGSSKAVGLSLKKLGIKTVYVSRNPTKQEISYSQIDSKLLSSHQLIVNCTPLGMYPSITQFPLIPYDKLNSKNCLFDLIYNPEITLFLEKGYRKGAKISNGLQMLHLQAEDAWKIWTHE